MLMPKEILLTKHNLTYVDDDAYEILSYYPWNSYVYGWKKKSVIAARPVFLKETGKRTSLYLHRMLAGVPQCFRVKHVNKNLLDNTHENLRICDENGNVYKFKPFTGKTTFKGVKWNGWHGLWEATFHKLSIGLYPNEVDAARAYNVKMREIDPNSSTRSKFPINTIPIMNNYLKNNGKI